jgi:hypothetical protein
MGETQTTEPGGQNIIRELRDKGFHASDEQLAVALGRPPEEIHAMANGLEEPDEDAVIKARGIADQRGIELSETGPDDTPRN